MSASSDTHKSVSLARARTIVQNMRKERMVSAVLESPKRSRASTQAAACGPGPEPSSSAALSAASASAPAERPKAEPRRRLLVSLDVEANGPSPANHSVISVGIVVADESRWAPHAEASSWVVGSLEVNMLPQKKSHVAFDKWVRSFDGLESHLRTNAKRPRDAAIQIRNFIRDVSKDADLSWVCSPSSADWMWFKHFMHQYLSDVELSGIDIGFFAECLKTRHNALLALGLSPLYVRTICFKDDLPHTHRARDDALEQANRYMSQSLMFDQIRGVVGMGWNLVLPTVVDSRGVHTIPVPPAHALGWLAT
jgi:hypothetical protein